MNFITLKELKIICQWAAEGLDKQEPDWPEKIDLTNLDLKRCDECILHYVLGTTDHNRILGEIRSRGLDKRAFGYPGPPGLNDKESDEYYSALNEIWTELIKQRKKGFHGRF